MTYVTGEYYHVYNRGVDKRTIFQKDADYKRFLYVLGEFNSPGSSDNTFRKVGHSVRNPISNRSDCLVEVVDYCLMPNHFHLILRQIQDGGISKYMQKVGIGYTHYFNLKYNRSGVLFQGRTKKKHVNSEEYYQYLVEYVYFNPIDLIEPGWKENGIKDINRVIDFLDTYQWTSGENHLRFKNQF